MKELSDERKQRLKALNLISQSDILFYEIAAHPFAENVSNKFLQHLLSQYFIWKVRRKYKRYLYRMKINEIITQEGFG